MSADTETLLLPGAGDIGHPFDGAPARVFSRNSRCCPRIFRSFGTWGAPHLAEPKTPRPGTEIRLPGVNLKHRDPDADRETEDWGSSVHVY